MAGLPFSLHDGGRKAAGFKGHAGDCAVRAIAIAEDRPYREVYDELFAEAKAYNAKRPVRKRQNASPRTGVNRVVLRRYLAARGWTWVPTARVGQAPSIRLRPGDLPKHERLIVNLRKHVAAVICGHVCDTHDPCRDGTRPVFGYWTREGTR